MANTVLIPVFTGTLSDSIVQLCDARTLYTFMQVKRDFTTWIKGRIQKFGFIAGVDFNEVFNLSSPDLVNSKSRAQKLTDYHLTLDMAKELSMVENNDMGRQARRYFIECEKAVLTAQDLPATKAQRLEAAMQAANAVAAQVQSSVMRSILNGGDDWKHQRWMFSFITDSKHGNPPVVDAIGSDAVVASLKELASMIEQPGGMMPSNEELANLIKACANRLASRMTHQARTNVVA